jgi:NADPH-dependent ferric siderophore reductase
VSHLRPPQLQGLATLSHKQSLTPGLLRLHFTAPTLAAMEIGKPAHALHVWWGGDAQDKTQRRVFTLRQFDPEQGRLAIDLVLHPQGLASHWARAARPGAQLIMAGPRSGYVWPAQADWRLAVVDTSALPALATLIEQSPPERPMLVLSVLHDPRDLAYLQDLPVPPGRLQLLPPCTPAQPACWQNALQRLLSPGKRPAGVGAAFVAGETAWVSQVRTQLEALCERPAMHIHASGYWQQSHAGFQHR